ncbi:hypothetical protein M404DRAFT_31833 [Pisolithus tinctorius Marx 270]|uniref:Uncharacterized protein n=1 Tax=Pisolithus tinctorius Marx 270 TaxID=870435 RepID=A0A0C3NRI0_PISTI|nr:hypothetical protein M404DRAFT_31833 [Pisolithus tinctorius Marx 270]
MQASVSIPATSPSGGKNWAITSNSKFVMINIWVAGNVVVYDGNARNLGGTFEYFKGGASTPASSRDGRPLAFVRHVRDELLRSSRIN